MANVSPRHGRSPPFPRISLLGSAPLASSDLKKNNGGGPVEQNKKKHFNGFQLPVSAESAWCRSLLEKKSAVSILERLVSSPPLARSFSDSSRCWQHPLSAAAEAIAARKWRRKIHSSFKFDRASHSPDWLGAERTPRRWLAGENALSNDLAAHAALSAESN